MKKLQIFRDNWHISKFANLHIISFLFCFLLSTLSLNAQNKQFPDSNFEGEGWIKETAFDGKLYDEFNTSFFYTLNSLWGLDNKPRADLTAYKDSKTAQNGQSCIKLVSGSVGVGELGEIVFLPGMVGTLNKGFVGEFIGSDSASVTVKSDWAGYPTPCALEGWYKYNPVAGDSALIEIGFYDIYSEKPDVYECQIIHDATDTTVNGWQHFSISIPEKYWVVEYAYIRTLFVASAKINWDKLMQCGGQEGSTLWIDNISLRYPGDGIKQNLLSSLTANLFPNPATEVLNIELNEEFAGKIIVYNIFGSKVLEENINGTKHQLNTSELATGNYVYRLINDNTIFAQGKFVITK